MLSFRNLTLFIKNYFGIVILDVNTKFRISDRIAAVLWSIIYCTYIIERTCIKQRYKVKAKRSGLFILSLFTRLRREVLAAHIARALYANNATCSIQGRKKTKMLHYRIAPRVEFYFILSQSITRTERPQAPSDLCFELRIRNIPSQ